MQPTDITTNLQCPATAGELQWMPPEELENYRNAVLAGLLVNRAGELVTAAPEAMLVCPPAGLGYAVHGGIPVLIAEQAIALEQLDCGLLQEENPDGGNRLPEDHR